MGAMLAPPAPPASSSVVVTINHAQDGSVRVVAETARLRLRPVEESDVVFYQALFSDPQVMSKYASGKPVADPDYAQKRLVDNKWSWTERWAKGSPWSGMVVELVDSGPTPERIGSVVIGGGELAFLFKTDFQGKGYGTEATRVLVNAIVPALARDPLTPDVPEFVEATVGTTHVRCQKVLEACGMKSDKAINKREWGGEEFERFIYKVPVKELLERGWEGRSSLN